MYYSQKQLDYEYTSTDWKTAAILGIPDKCKRAMLQTAFQFPPAHELEDQYSITMKHTFRELAGNNEILTVAPMFCNLPLSDFMNLRILTNEGYSIATKLAIICNAESIVSYSPYLMMSIITMLIFLSKEETLFVAC